MQETVFSELFNYDIEEAKRMTKEKLALEVIDRLKKEYPDAGCTLDYDQAWKLLVSVRLAAQCTDARVNVVVEDLYAKYPDVASLAKAERNLSYATITSPIDGVVISRDVEAGQTVASGFETPTLFTIAADLTQMQVVAPEADARVRVVQVCKSQILVRRDLAAQPDKGLLGHLHQTAGVHAGGSLRVKAAFGADEGIHQKRVKAVSLRPLVHQRFVLAGV